MIRLYKYATQNYFRYSYKYKTFGNFLKWIPSNTLLSAMIKKEITNNLLQIFTVKYQIVSNCLIKVVLKSSSSQGKQWSSQAHITSNQAILEIVELLDLMNPWGKPLSCSTCSITTATIDFVGKLFLLFIVCIRFQFRHRRRSVRSVREGDLDPMLQPLWSPAWVHFSWNSRRARPSFGLRRATGIKLFITGFLGGENMLN